MLATAKIRKQIEGYVEVLCHRVAWRYWNFPPGIDLDSEGLAEELELAAEERAKECIVDGYNSGQLYCFLDGEHEVFGWWEIDRT